MQENILLSLYEGLHKSLIDFISDYRADHGNLLPEESASLTKLATIAKDLNALLTTSPSPKDLKTTATYERYIGRIQSVQPSEFVKRIHESGGFLGSSLGASKREEKLFVPLYRSMQYLIPNLQKSLLPIVLEEQRKAQSAIALEEERTKQPAKEDSEKNPEIEAIKKQLANFNNRLTASEAQIAEARVQGEQVGFEKGKQAGKQELIEYVKKHLYLLADNPQQNLLLLLDGKEPVLPQSTSAPVPNVFTKKSETPVIKTETDEENKAREWIGDAKFPVVQQFMSFHNSKNVSEQEKIIARWVIFMLMLHKYDQSISSILGKLQEALQDKCKLDITQLSIKKVFDANAQIHDSVSTQQLTEKELRAFYQLTHEKTATYLPVDNTASTCFGSKAAIMKGQSVKETTEEDYTNKVIDKLTKPALAPANALS